MRIRLYGIDAPEYNQSYGKSSKNYLIDLCQGKKVKIDIVDRDKLGRFVGKIYVGKTCLNEEMIKIGLAWAYRYFLRDKDKNIYIELEEIAKNNKRGLWKEAYKTAPWDFRRKYK